MSLELLAGLKGVRTPPGLGSKLKAWWRSKWPAQIQVVGPRGAGVTSYLLQLVQPGILDEAVMDHYNGGKPFSCLVQSQGTIRKLKVKDVLVDDEEKRFRYICADFMDRKPNVVVWIAPGRPDILADPDRPEYDLFRRYVQFLMADKYPNLDGSQAKKRRPKALVFLVNHMDEYERLWSVNFFDFLHHYRQPLAYIRKNYKDVRVVTQPCCAWANVGVREPLMDVLMDLDIENA